MVDASRPGLQPKTSRQDALRAADRLPGRLRYLPITAASWLSPMRTVALSRKETRKEERVSGVGGNRTLEYGRLPVDSNWQPARKRAGSCSWDTALSFGWPIRSRK